DAALLEASVTPHEGARSWAYCWGTDDVLQVEGPKGSVSAETLAVSGDFFVFHQLAFTYGGGFLNNDSIPMGVVLDRDLAWRVYGSENIVGMPVTVRGEEYTIVGITDRESSSAAYKRAYGSVPRMYMNYAGYSKIGEKRIALFEAALPNSVRGFAMSIFTDSVHYNQSAASLIEATDRFSLKNRFANMKELSYAWVSINKIEVPYWENEARVMDYRAAVMMVFEVALAAVAGTSLLLSFILLRASGWTFTDTVKNLWKKFSEKRRLNKKEKPEKPVRSKSREKKRKKEVD
ncbi:MAG: ABC transporter permease, partial [Clostridia bacterium]|nr:ABC transporter permease [Clostridia bacterium]